MEDQLAQRQRDSATARQLSEGSGLGMEVFASFLGDLWMEWKEEWKRSNRSWRRGSYNNQALVHVFVERNVYEEGQTHEDKYL